MGPQEDNIDEVEEDDDDFFTEDDFRAAAYKVAEEYEVAEMSLDDFMDLLSEQVGGVDLAEEQALIARIKKEAENGELQFDPEEQQGFEDEDLVDPTKQRLMMNYAMAKKFFQCCNVFLCLIVVALVVLVIMDPFADEVDRGVCVRVRTFVDSADNFNFADNRALGDSVAYSGGLVAVGRPRMNGRNGAVSLYRYDNGEELKYIFRPDENIFRPDESKDEVFGRAVAMDGDALVIAAKDANTGAGRVFVYSAASGNITHTLTSPVSIPAELSFGHTVAISGDTVLVGPKDGRGPIYTFSALTGKLLNEIQIPPDASDLSESIDISGDNIVVGAPADGNGLLRGAVYVFSAETGAFKRKIVATDGAANNQLGESVTISGDIIAASSRNSKDRAKFGSVYLFSATTGEQIRKLVAPTEVENDEREEAFRWSPLSLAVSENIVYVSEYGSNGAVYVMSAESGNLFDTIVAPSGAGRSFARSLDASGRILVLGDSENFSSVSAYLTECTIKETIVGTVV